MNRPQIWNVAGVILLVFGLQLYGQQADAGAAAKAANFIVFDVPGSVGTTSANAINPQGAITGSYADAGGAPHGFLRARDGTFTTFGPLGGSPSINPVGINPGSAIVGFYL